MMTAAVLAQHDQQVKDTLTLALQASEWPADLVALVQQLVVNAQNRVRASCQRSSASLN